MKLKSKLAAPFLFLIVQLTEPDCRGRRLWGILASETGPGGGPGLFALLHAFPFFGTQPVGHGYAAGQCASQLQPRPRAAGRRALYCQCARAGIGAGPGARAGPAHARRQRPRHCTATGPAATYLQAGRVLDESGQPLVGATVLLRGTSRGTSTDASGSYLLEVPKGENTFLVGYAGYEDETASSHDGQPLTVTLLPAPGASPSSPAKGRRRQR